MGGPPDTSGRSRRMGQHDVPPATRCRFGSRATRCTCPRSTRSIDGCRRSPRSFRCRSPPIAKGRPGCGFPAPWSIYGWLEGEPAAVVGVNDHDRLADDLARFLRLSGRAHRGWPTGGSAQLQPRWARLGVGRTDTHHDRSARRGDRRRRRLRCVGRRAAAEWAGPDVWVHGDVTGSNLLCATTRCAASSTSAVRPSAIRPAISRQRGRCSRGRAGAFMRCRLDDGTWARARGWALWKALIDIPGRPVDDPGRTGARFGWRWDAHGVIDQVISDFRADWMTRSPRPHRRSTGASSRAHQLCPIPLDGFLTRCGVPPAVDQPSWLGHRDPNLDRERRRLATHREHPGFALAQHGDRVGVAVAGDEEAPPPWVLPSTACSAWPRTRSSLSALNVS